MKVNKKIEIEWYLKRRILNQISPQVEMGIKTY